MMNDGKSNDSRESKKGLTEPHLTLLDYFGVKLGHQLFEAPTGRPKDDNRLI